METWHTLRDSPPGPVNHCGMEPPLRKTDSSPGGGNNYPLNEIIYSFFPNPPPCEVCSCLRLRTPAFLSYSEERQFFFLYLLFLSPKLSMLFRCSRLFTLSLKLPSSACGCLQKACLPLSSSNWGDLRLVCPIALLLNCNNIDLDLFVCLTTN